LELKYSKLISFGDELNERMIHGIFKMYRYPKLKEWYYYKEVIVSYFNNLRSEQDILSGILLLPINEIRNHCLFDSINDPLQEYFEKKLKELFVVGNEYDNQEIEENLAKLYDSCYFETSDDPLDELRRWFDVQEVEEGKIKIISESGYYVYMTGCRMGYPRIERKQKDYLEKIKS